MYKTDFLDLLVEFKTKAKPFNRVTQLYLNTDCAVCCHNIVVIIPKFMDICTFTGMFILLILAYLHIPI